MAFQTLEAPEGDDPPLHATPRRRQVRAATRIAECQRFTSKLQIQSERHAAKQELVHLYITDDDTFLYVQYNICIYLCITSMRVTYLFPYIFNGISTMIGGRSDGISTLIHITYSTVYEDIVESLNIPWNHDTTTSSYPIYIHVCVFCGRDVVLN